MRYLRRKNNQGNVLIFTILVITILFVVMSSLSVLMISELRQSGQIEDSASAYLAAEAGAERALNYANNHTEITKINQPLSAPPNQPKYSFEVKKAGAGAVLGDGTPCDTSSDPHLYYCFYSEGYSGSGKIVRKLNGFTRINDVSQTTPFDFSAFFSGTRTCAHDSYNNSWQLYPSAPNEQVSLMDVTPCDPRNDMVVLSGQINVITDPPADYYFGLLDNGSGDRKGIGLHIYNKNADNWIELTGTTINTDCSPPQITHDNHDIPTGSGNPIKITPTNSIRFVLTYRRAASDPNAHTVTLQVNDANKAHSPCLGVRTFLFKDQIFNHKPFYAYFLSEGQTKPMELSSQYLALKETPSSYIVLDSFVLATSGSNSVTAAPAAAPSCPATPPPPP